MGEAAKDVTAVANEEKSLERKAEAVAALMGQLANGNRLLILCALQDGPKTVGVLGKAVPGISAPAISQHLHKLRESGLIIGEKKGQFVEYRLADERLQKLLQVLKEEYC